MPFSSVVRARWLSYHFVSGSLCTSRSNGWVLLLIGSRGRGVGRGRGLSLFSVVAGILGVRLVSTYGSSGLVGWRGLFGLLSYDACYVLHAQWSEQRDS